jgi:hypothetical protein
MFPKNGDWKYYNGQKYIVIDEFRGESDVLIQTLLQMVDGHNYQVNTKRDSKMLLSGCIFYVISKQSPRDLFKDCLEEDLDGIRNRFHERKIVYPLFPRELWNEVQIKQFGNINRRTNIDSFRSEEGNEDQLDIAIKKLKIDFIRKKRGGG